MNTKSVLAFVGIIMTTMILMTVLVAAVVL